MEPLRLCGPVAAALVFFGAAIGTASADFLWFRTPKAKPTLSIVIEDNVRGGCLQDREAVVRGIGTLLDGHGIEVAESSTTNLVIYAVGHPASAERYGRRRTCVGVMTVEVSSLSVDDANSFRVTSLYARERLLVSRDLLDGVLLNNAREVIDNFSRWYAHGFK